ncbi:selenocysteine-specific translation elongation factor SelB [Desulfosporosinus acidiphilus SJ4]|uniref:Selenocysteine-specific elongation factor n=1 Tax=Desulfosporosinus acidiphilus (strain DSM 22704 / JCM 16185 / SJ4) TaxID=646529 RepID=I4DCL4_DESAJ|nr:selenocysteine-specific translation elongation factor [Desulfosporosinus acidiphilus]AFM43538.1 selenocysteine-specific translation elongation factor SelB [Desulfosporosinus acidiphilus SJ4]
MTEKHYLVGTAGHVDHGKTELIRALSGIETDRLREEKQRGISIELGFAHMVLPSGRKVSIVDVPGHERFIRQMLAGASGMDIVLLVIAADEGIMPQTKEHLDILTLLEIPRGIVVLNKIDLVDEEWLDLMEEDIIEKLKNTVFENVPICRVSAVKGLGLEPLKREIDQILSEVESKKSTGPVRMPIDRVFSIQGFGTVVTGTLQSGTVILGQELAIEPGEIKAKVRSVQVHNEKVKEASAGQRVAVNLAGVDVAEVERGSVLVTPNVFPAGTILDLSLRNLPSSDKPITQRQRVRFHIGTTEVLGRIHLLNHEELTPGQEGFAQILLEEPVAVASGDRFVLRFYSPPHTIGGGKILGVADYKQKRFKENVLAQMRIKDLGDPLDLLEKEISEPRSFAELATRLQISTDDLENRITIMEESGRLEVLMEDDTRLLWGSEAARNWRERLVEVVRNYETHNPLRLGISRGELKSRLNNQWSNRRWQTVLEQGAEKNVYILKGSKVQSIDIAKMPQEIEKRLENLREKWLSLKLTPPDLIASAETLGISKNEAADYAQYLCDTGEWIHVDQYYYPHIELERAHGQLKEYLEHHGEIGVSEVRELWGTSRKYAVPLLEYFDQQKVTKRIGDKRKLY